MRLGTKLARFVIGLDQALNPLIFGGSEDVTLSAQSAYRELVLNKSGKWRKLIDWIFRRFGQEHHCYKSLRVEIDEFAGDRELILKLLAEHGVERG